jgi:hypothetical protein
MDEIYEKIKPYLAARNIFLAIFLLLFAIIFWNFSRAWSFHDTSWPLEKGEKEKIRTEIMQKFKAERDGLARIKVLFGSSDVSPGGTFTLDILDEDCKKSVRKIELDITSLESDKLTDFIFPKIKDSNGKTYCLTLSYDQMKGGKKAEIFLSPRAPQVTYFSINGQELTDKSMPMRPAYKNASIFGDIEEMNQRISQYKPFFLKHYYLYFIVFGFLILSIGLVIILILT